MKRKPTEKQRLAFGTRPFKQTRSVVTTKAPVINHRHASEASGLLDWQTRDRDIANFDRAVADKPLAPPRRRVL